MNLRILPFTFSVLLAFPAIAQKPIQIAADLSEAPRKLYHAEIEIPVSPGPVTLITPEWIPGDHRPTGPASDITGVVFTANGQTLPWRRDDTNLYEFHVTVPAGVTTLHAHLDCIVTSRVSAKLAVLEWEKLLLYPANTPVKDIPIQPSVTVPAGWGIGTALSPTGSGASTIANTGVDEADHLTTPGATTMHYAATTVEQLEDSPVVTGEYFHEFPLAPEVTPKHYIDVVADSPEDSELRPELLAELSNLVRETGAMYGPRHYHVYHFLLTLSDVAGGEGLEHGQSSDNGVGEKGFSDDDHQLAESDLLPHEFTHSWNGKYRRPFNLYQTDFATMQQGSLLWVYEGMTQYLGNVLAARSGLRTQAQYRDLLAMVAANLDNKPGHEWRNTEDTAIAASILRDDDPAWSNWRRGQDYYFEGELLWLDADTTIRKLTNNKRSLKDFEHIFLGKGGNTGVPGQPADRGGNTGPLIVPYHFDELVQDLNQVVPYDWANFLHTRITALSTHANLEGIEQGGYKLVYTDKPTESEKTMDSTSRRHPGPDVWYSLGLRLKNDGTITDVRWGGPADNAKLIPGQKIIAADGIIFSADALTSAIKQSKDNTTPIHLILQTDKFVTLADIDYHGGERYPSLQRIEGTPDYLDDITKPLTKPQHAPSKAE